MKLDNLKGSYDFSAFPCSEEEFWRLRRQALTLWDREAALILQSGLQPHMRVLDIGCGPGFISDKITGLLSDGQVIGLEIDDRLFKIASAIADTNPKFQVQKGNIYSLDFPDQSFDFVYTRFVFQHLEKPEVALAEIHRILKPGGIVLVLDVDDDWLTLYPEPPEFKTLIKRSEAAQAARGGDRFVGRKMPLRMKTQNFSSVTFRVEVVTSDDMGIEHFLQIISGFKLALMLQTGECRTEVEAMITRINDYVRQQKSYGAIGVFLTKGQK